MERNTLKNILDFLEEKEGMEIPEIWSLINELETHPDGIQYRYNGYIYLIESSIKNLPNDLYVGGGLVLEHCEKLKKLPDMLYVGATLTLDYCTQLTKLSDNLYVGVDLVLNDVNITEIPNNLYVGGDLYLGDTPLAKKYTDKEIIKIVESNRGQIEGKIIRQ